MTMLLGFNIGKLSFISADTRVTYYNTKRTEDNVQKIEILNEKKIVVAAAGSTSLAAEFLSAIKIGKIAFPATKSQLLLEADKIVESYLDKIFSLPKQPNQALMPIILLIEYIHGDDIGMVAYWFSFMENNLRATKIREYIIKPNEFVKIGAIGENAPVHVSGDSGSISE